MNEDQVNAEIAKIYTTGGQLVSNGEPTDSENMKALQCYLTHLESYKLILRAKELIK